MGLPVPCIYGFPFHIFWYLALFSLSLSPGSIDERRACTREIIDYGGDELCKRHLTKDSYFKDACDMYYVNALKKEKTGVTFFVWRANQTTILIFLEF